MFDIPPPPDLLRSPSPDGHADATPRPDIATGNNRDNNPDAGPTLASRFARYAPTANPTAWLSATGAVLVLIAAVVSTAARWSAVPVWVRLVGLVVLHGLVVFLSERFRSPLPTVTRVLAHLAAAMALPTVIATVATAHGSWRECILIGGLVCAGVLELWAHRWKAPVLRAAESVVLSVAAAGAAALTGASVGVLIAGAAVVALLAGLQRRACALAVFAAATPLLGVLVRLKVGPGTMAEIGAYGEASRWTGPIAGLIATVVLGVVAYRRRNPIVAGLAAAALVGAAGQAVWQLDGTISPTVWACVPAVLLIGMQLGVVLARRVRPALESELAGWAAGFEVAAIPYALFLSGTLPRWFVPVLALCAGWLAGALRPTRAWLHYAVPTMTASVCSYLALTAWHEPSTIGPWVAFAIVAVVAWMRRDIRLGHVAGAGFALALAAQVIAIDRSDLRWWTSTTSAVTMLCAGALLVVPGLVRRRGLRPLDAAGCAALVVGPLFIAEPRWMWSALTASGLAYVVVGLAHRHRALRWIGAALSIVSAIVMWVEVTDATPTLLDLFVAAVVAGLVGLEHRTRRDRDGGDLWLNPPYLSGAVVAAAYLIGTMIASMTDVRIATTMVIGIVAAGAGLFVGLSSVAIAGIVVSAAALVTASWRQLSSLPTWMWMLIGGLGLIAAAIVVERRRSEPDPDGPRDESTVAV